eukprot:1392143-Amorphochlora_amoeboformis.AAC.2
MVMTPGYAEMLRSLTPVALGCIAMIYSNIHSIGIHQYVERGGGGRNSGFGGIRFRFRTKIACSALSAGCIRG